MPDPDTGKSFLPQMLRRVLTVLENGPKQGMTREDIAAQASYTVNTVRTVLRDARRRGLAQSTGHSRGVPALWTAIQDPPDAHQDGCTRPQRSPRAGGHG